MLVSQAQRVLKNIDIMRKYAEGSKIQWRNALGEWEDIQYPSFDGEPSKYRVKPKPKFLSIKTTTFLIARHDDGVWFIRKSKKAADRLMKKQRDAGFDVTMRRVDVSIERSSV